MKSQQHWENVWSRYNPRDVGWYQESPGVSLSLIERTGIGLDGPRKCSGLRVARYGPQEITTLLGSSFQLLEVVHETHLTPDITKQRFTYFHLRNHR